MMNNKETSKTSETNKSTNSDIPANIINETDNVSHHPKLDLNSFVKRQLFKEEEEIKHLEDHTTTISAEILELVNHLVTTTVNNFDENTFKHQNNFNSDDSNEASFIVEKEPMQLQESKNSTHEENSLQSREESNSMELAVKTSSTTEAIEVTSCEIKPLVNVMTADAASPGDEDDSDIEVLTVSSKPISLVNKKQQQQQQHAPQNHVAIFGESKTQNSLSNLLNNSSNNALLDSISEHEVNCLVNGGDVADASVKLNEIAEEIESSALISNYDLIADANSQPIFESKSNSKPKSLVDYSINSNDDSSLNQSKESSYVTSNSQIITTSSHTKTQENRKSKKESTRPKSDQQKETNIFIEDTNTNSNSSSVNIHESNLITNADTTIDYNTKPFFASKLTNSQLSEELSNEIGL
jgi:hypothetical protein